MSFFGKNFKKTKFENLDELFEAINMPEKVRIMFKNTEAITRFDKNADGTIQLTVTKSGEVVLTQKMTPDVESDFVTPDGVAAKVHCKLTGDRLDTTMSFPDGVKFHMDRVYENNTLKQVVYKDNVDLKGTIYYEAV